MVRSSRFSLGLCVLGWVSLQACGGESTRGNDAGAAGEDGAGRGGGAAGKSEAAGRAGGYGASVGSLGGNGSGGNSASGCVVDGVHYAVGDRWAPTAAGCNACSCYADGVFGCTAIGCPTGGSGQAGGGVGGAGGLTCDDVRDALEDELEQLQRCEADSECGQVLSGTSCGCTRDLVARSDADTTRFEELAGTLVDGESCNQFASTCDCPEADGFVCSNGRCAWNYVSAGD